MMNLEKTYCLKGNEILINLSPIEPPQFCSN